MNHYLVAGLGKTGLSIARYLQRKECSFVLFDTRANAPGLAECAAEFPLIPLYLEHIPAEVLEHVTDIITSPGLSLDLPLFQQAREQNIAIYGDIECLAREISAPIIAITGTNGKSTVTTLVGEMAKANGMNVAVAGNIGTPVLDLLATPHDYDLWVLELSSFQLDLCDSLRARAATILNISPDHLDRHHTLDAYKNAKQRIYHQAQTIIYNRDDEATYADTSLQSASTAMYSFGSSAPKDVNDWGLLHEHGQVFLAKGQNRLLDVNSISIKGVHNWLNALAACALADAVGIPLSVMSDVLQCFAGLEHRCQWVRTLDKVDWINDSKGTNIGATISAINGIGSAISGKIVLIAGGQGKGADFHDLRAVAHEFVRDVVLIGEDAPLLDAALADVVTVHRTASLEHAVLKAKTCAQSGDVVLLSPACASLDMFKDYNHRGEVFTLAVMEL